MKIKLHFGNEKAIKKSGIGRALVHQKQALGLYGIAHTTDKTEMDYDILHINTVGPDSLKAIRHARKHGKKVIYHAHSTEEDFRNSFMFSNMVAPLFKWWLIRLYGKADSIITPTPYAKKILESYGLKMPIRAISNGVDVDAFTASDADIQAFRQRFAIQNEAVFICAGWLFERKGFDTFIEVAKTLPHCRFIWFGDITLSFPTRKIRNLLRNLPSNVTLPGYVEPTLLRGAYGGCTAFFFPSREETEGIVVLEALSCKAPVVVRDIPVFEDWLTSGENCYKGTSSSEFASILTTLAQNQEKKTVTQGHHTANARSLKRVGAELKNAYEEVLQLAP